MSIPLGSTTRRLSITIQGKFQPNTTRTIGVWDILSRAPKPFAREKLQPKLASCAFDIHFTPTADGSHHPSPPDLPPMNTAKCDELIEAQVL